MDEAKQEWMGEVVKMAKTNKEADLKYASEEFIVLAGEETNTEPMSK
jgi:hypothetical protein